MAPSTRVGPTSLLSTLLLLSSTLTQPAAANTCSSFTIERQAHNDPYFTSTSGVSFQVSDRIVCEEGNFGPPSLPEDWNYTLSCNSSQCAVGVAPGYRIRVNATVAFAEDDDSSQDDEEEEEGLSQQGNADDSQDSNSNSTALEASGTAGRANVNDDSIPSADRDSILRLLAAEQDASANGFPGAGRIDFNISRAYASGGIATCLNAGEAGHWGSTPVVACFEGTVGSGCEDERLSEGTRLRVCAPIVRGGTTSDGDAYIGGAGAFVHTSGLEAGDAPPSADVEDDVLLDMEGEGDGSGSGSDDDGNGDVEDAGSGSGAAALKSTPSAALALAVVAAAWAL